MVEEAKKICPLISYRTAKDRSDVLNEERWCYEKECALYDETNVCCSILTIAEKLNDIEISLPVG